MTAPPVRKLWEMEELVEEILIRIPPEEPAVLVRASLACKPWCRLLSGNGFRSRYLTLHKTPPILGFLQSWEDTVERFVPTTNFCPRNPNRRDNFVVECRHGRVLLVCDWDEAEEKEDEREKTDKLEEEDGMDEEEDDMVEEKDNDTKEEEEDGMDEEEDDMEEEKDNDTKEEQDDQGEGEEEDDTEEVEKDDTEEEDDMEEEDNDTKDEEEDEDVGEEEDDTEEEEEDDMDEEEDDMDEEEEEEDEDEGEEEDDTEEEEDDTEEEEEEDEDERHEEGNLKMVVWDPVSGNRTKLRAPEINATACCGTVLCAADGCNHAACNLGPFFVALIGLKLDEQYEHDKRLLCAFIYSSETREWTSPASVRIGGIGIVGASIIGRPSVLVGQALHFLLRPDPLSWDLCIMKYDFGTDRLSAIDLPELRESSWNPLLISADDSGLGLVHLHLEEDDMLGHNRLCFMWLVEVSVDGVASLVQLRKIDLKTLVPIGNPASPLSVKLVGCVEGTGSIIAVTDLGAFTVDLKSLRLRKLSSRPCNFAFRPDGLQNIFLYTSFNNPPAVAGAVAEAETKISK